jgi:hypothetical protein
MSIDILSKAAILPKYGRSDSDWLLANIPFLDGPDQSLLDTYYYRWWSYKQNTLYNADFGGYVVNEGGGYGITSCPVGHHLYDGRWLRDPKYMDDNLRCWVSGKSQPRRYANWLADGVWAKYLADQNKQGAPWTGSRRIITDGSSSTLIQTGVSSQVETGS